MAWVKIADRSTYWELSDSTTPNSTDIRNYWMLYYDNVPDIANNRTQIKIEYYYQVNGQSNLSTTFYSNARINGSDNTKTIPQGTYYQGVNYFTSQTLYITHDSNGNGSFTFRGLSSSPTASYFNQTTSTSTYTLPSIPRATTINSFTFVKASGGAGLSRLTCNWSVSNTCDAVEYSLSGGGWTSSGTSGTSGSFNISGLTPNTQYSLRIRVKRTDSQLWTESGTIYQTTYDRAKITVAPNNNVDVEPPFTITYTNPSGASLQTGIYKTDASTVIAPYRVCTSTGYEYLFTAGERTAFYNQTPTTKTLPLRIYLTTSDGLGNTYSHYVERTFEVVNANPTFTTWTYADTNATTLALTGNNQKIIKGYSNVKATITSANKMVANKGATATSYQLTIGTKPSATVAYSAGSTVEMTVNAVDNNVMTCYAIDSRSNSTPKEITASTYINYTPISITSATATRTDGISTQTTLAFSGNIFDGSFGSVSNSVKSATYKFKKTTDVEYTDGTSVITPTKTGGTFSFSGTIKGDAGTGGVNGFDATHSYNIQVIVTDELSTHTFNFILGSGKPNIAMHRDGIAINQPYDETLGGALQVNGAVTFGGSPVLKESDIIDNLTTNDATKVLSAKQGKELDNRLANLEYDATWTLNKSSSNSGWCKMMRIETANNCIMRIIGISSVSALSTRGHFELLIGTGSNNQRCDSIIKTNGLTTASFDYRLVSANVYEIWFYIPQYTFYNMKAYIEYGPIPIITTYSEIGTPSGTVLTVG